MDSKDAITLMNRLSGLDRVWSTDGENNYISSTPEGELISGMYDCRDPAAAVWGSEVVSDDEIREVSREALLQGRFDTAALCSLAIAGDPIAYVQVATWVADA